MKINWRVRAKNPIFWLTAIPSVLSLIYTILALFGIVPKITEAAIMAAVAAVVRVLALLGIVNDPTVNGWLDSNRAMTYAEPYKEEAQIDEH